MPYALKLYLYLGVGFVVAVFVSDQWLRHLSSTIVLAVGVRIRADLQNWGSKWHLGHHENLEVIFLDDYIERKAPITI